MPIALPQVVTVSAASPGPTVALLGGVHGDEYEGVIAARWLMTFLQSMLIRGTVRVAAPAHPAAWESTSRESPTDGKNLARVFPGSPDGSATDIVAHEITQQLIMGADLLIDLHSAGTNFEMPFLCGFQDNGVDITKTSQHFARIFGAEFTWRHSGKPAPGRSLSVAYDLNIPAIYTEAGGGRSVWHDELQGFTDGVRRVLHSLSMLENAPPVINTSTRVVGDGNTDAGITAPIPGYLVMHVATGEPCEKGQIVADILDLNAATRCHIAAPNDGYLMMRRREARVNTGDTVLIFAAKDEG